MKEIVTLSGDIGGGKSSVARILSASLGYPIISAGGMQREIAASMGLTTLQLNEQSAKDRSVDDRIDAYTKMLGETRDRIIVDSRLAWHFIPSAFKVFLTVDPEVGARRVFEASREEEKNQSLQHTIDNNRARRQLEATRFQALYGIVLRQYSNYDLVVDTSFAAPEQVAAVIEAGLHARIALQPYARVWMCPKRLIELPATGGSSATAANPVTDVVLTAIDDGQFALVSGRIAAQAALAAGTALLAATLQ